MGTDIHPAIELRTFNCVETFLALREVMRILYKQQHERWESLRDFTPEKMRLVFGFDS